MNINKVLPASAGLTGSIGSGKSTVAAIFERLGATILDADLLAREVVQKGRPELAAIVSRFGPAALTAAGQLNRPYLASIVFGDAAKRKELEEIIHPAVRRLMRERVQALLKPGEPALDSGSKSTTLILCVVPLLFESSFDYRSLVEKIVTVSARPEVCLARIMRRDGLQESAAQLRLLAQLPDEEKIRRSDFVIYNNGTLAELETQVKETFERLLGSR